MQALNQTITKEELLKELRWHQAQDNFVKGKYFSDGKGCAVGSLESIARAKNIKISFDDHSQYPIHLGMPVWLARLEDSIFENLPMERAKLWPVEFIEAINPGSDLDQAKVPFLLAVQKKNIEILDSCIFYAVNFPMVAGAIRTSRAAVVEVIRCLESNLNLSTAWGAARSAARSAAESAAESAARSAAWSAAYECFADELLKLIRECR